MLLQVFDFCSNLIEFNANNFASNSFKLNLIDINKYLQSMNFVNNSLRILRLCEFQENLDEFGLQAILEKCTNLQIFEVKAATDFNGFCLSSLTCKLQSILIEDCPNMDINNISKFLNEHSRMLIKVNFGRNCLLNASDSCKAHLIDSIIKCEQLVDVTLDIKSVDLSRIGLLKNIEKLSIRTNNIHDAQFSDIISNLRQLKYIKVSLTDLNTSLTDHSMILMSSNCPLLEEIVLIGCDQVSDESLLHLSYLKHLRNITVLEMHRITTFGVHTFLKKVKKTLKLFRIGIFGCSLSAAVNKYEIETVCQQLRIKLDFIEFH